MRTVICGLAVAGLLFAGPAAASAPTRTARLTDQQLSQRIAHRLEQSRALRSDHIRVSVKNRVATLSGRVDSRADRLRADRLARVKGVRRVDDHLAVAVRATTGTIGDRDRRGTDRGTVGYAKEGTAKAREGVSRTGEAITDGWITTRVKTRFVGDDALKHSKIDVDTSNHVVTLKGFVPSEAGRARAVRIARTTEGVRSVDDRLEVASHK